MKLLKLKKITGKIVVQTGLHIGGSSDTLEIGGMDNPVIKNPLNGQPYIPGSSLKGKIRYLLEWKYNKINVVKEKDKNSNKERTEGNPCNCGNKNCFICRIFGNSNFNNKESGPTRVIFRDAYLEFKSLEDEKKEYVIEEKYENTIDRITAKANPRSMERVVPGTIFNLEIIYKIYDIDEDNGKADEDNFKYLNEGLKLLELDYLGGGGSRGNGKIKFEEIKIEDIDVKNIL